MAARVKVVQCSGPVDDADSARVVQLCERALAELDTDGPLVVQVATASEFDAFGLVREGRVVFGSADHSTVFLRDDTLGWGDIDFAGLVFEEVAHWWCQIGDPFWDEAWAVAFVRDALGIDWGREERGAPLGPYERGRAFGSALDGADTFAEWRRRGGRRRGRVQPRRA